MNKSTKKNYCESKKINYQQINEIKEMIRNVISQSKSYSNYLDEIFNNNNSEFSKKLNELVFIFIELIDLPSSVVYKITDYLFNGSCYVSTDYYKFFKTICDKYQKKFAYLIK